MNTRERHFALLDVFADGPFTGNPLPVILDAEGLDTEEMQRIARWMNHSETTFLLPPTDPDADYRVRIFTLERELPFAGHPTLGSCQAWLDAGGQARTPGRIVQQCGAGLVPVRPLDDGLAFASPPLLRSGPVNAAKRAEVAQVLDIEEARMRAVAWADNGPGWIIVRLDTAKDVLALEPARHHGSRIEIGVVGAHPAGHPAAWEVRTFFSDQHGNLREDPVTGSFNASAAQWLIEEGLAEPPWTAHQGARLGHAGRIRVRREDGALWIGGRVSNLVSGPLRLDLARSRS